MRFPDCLVVFLLFCLLRYPVGLSDYDRVAVFEAMHHQLEATSEDIVKIDININECPTISTCQQLISHVLSSYLLRPEVSWILKKYSKLTSIEQIDNLFLLSKAAESFEILFDIIEQSVMNHHPHVKGVHIVLTVGFLEGIAPDAFNQFLQFIKAQPRAITLLLCCNMANIDQYEHCEQMSFGLRSLRQLTLSSQTLFQQLFREIVVEGDLPIVFPCELLKLLGEEFDMYTCCSRTFTRRYVVRCCCYGCCCCVASLHLSPPRTATAAAAALMCSYVGWCHSSTITSTTERPCWP